MHIAPQFNSTGHTAIQHSQHAIPTGNAFLNTFGELELDERVLHSTVALPTPPTAGCLSSKRKKDMRKRPTHLLLFGLPLVVLLVAQQAAALLERYGGVIFMDSTHGCNREGAPLFTLAVALPDGTYHWVAFIITQGALLFFTCVACGPQLVYAQVQIQTVLFGASGSSWHYSPHGNPKLLCLIVTGLSVMQSQYYFHMQSSCFVCSMSNKHGNGHLDLLWAKRACHLSSQSHSLSFTSLLSTSLSISLN